MRKDLKNEDVIVAVNQSFTMREASIRLNIPYKTFIYRAKKLGIYKPNQGRTGLPKTPKQLSVIKKRAISLADIFDNKYPNYSLSTLKQRLLNNGIFENRCSVCSLTEWQNKPLTMELDHIDGDHTNFNKENLRMICPNCHAQTHNYGSKNSKRHRKWNTIPNDQFISEAKKQLPTTRISIKKILVNMGLNYRNMNLFKHVQQVVKNNALVSQLVEETRLDRV